MLPRPGRARLAERDQLSNFGVESEEGHVVAWTEVFEASLHVILRLLPKSAASHAGAGIDQNGKAAPNGIFEPQRGRFPQERSGEGYGQNHQSQTAKEQQQQMVQAAFSCQSWRGR